MSNAKWTPQLVFTYTYLHMYVCNTNKDEEVMKVRSSGGTEEELEGEKPM